MRLVLASNNRGKLAELQSMFAPLGVELVRQADLGVGEAEAQHLAGRQAGSGAAERDARRGQGGEAAPSLCGISSRRTGLRGIRCGGIDVAAHAASPARSGAPPPGRTMPFASVSPIRTSHSENSGARRSPITSRR